MLYNLYINKLLFHVKVTLILRSTLINDYINYERHRMNSIN